MSRALGQPQAALSRVNEGFCGEDLLESEPWLRRLGLPWQRRAGARRVETPQAARRGPGRPPEHRFGGVWSPGMPGVWIACEPRAGVLQSGIVLEVFSSRTVWTGDPPGGGFRGILNPRGVRRSRASR
jgi:hypothetical protein